MNDYKNRFIDSLNSTQITNLEREVIGFNEGIEKIITILKEAKRKEKGVFFVGNGGSAGVAVHMTADYLKNGGMRAQSLHEPCTLTCLGNDFGYEYVFSKQLDLLIKKQDVLIAISSSGNSANILNAVELARIKHAKIITLSGFSQDNKLRGLGDYNIYVPVSLYGIVESNHNYLLQMIVDLIADSDIEIE